MARRGTGSPDAPRRVRRMPVHPAHGFSPRARAHVVQPLVALRLARLLLLMLLRLCVLQVVPSSARRHAVAAAAARRGGAAVVARPELCLFRAAVAQERAEGDNVADRRGGQQLNRRPHGAEDLVAP